MSKLVNNGQNNKEHIWVKLKKKCKSRKKKLAGKRMYSKHRPRFFEKSNYKAPIKNKNFFTKSCHHQTYQNYEQPHQRLQNFDFQRPFSASKSVFF